MCSGSGGGGGSTGSGVGAGASPSAGGAPSVGGAPSAGGWPSAGVAPENEKTHLVTNLQFNIVKPIFTSNNKVNILKVRV